MPMAAIGRCWHRHPLWFFVSGGAHPRPAADGRSLGGEAHRPRIPRFGAVEACPRAVPSTAGGPFYAIFPTFRRSQEQGTAVNED